MRSSRQLQVVPMEVGKLIQKGRNQKSMTQKELATKINEKPQVINEYEQGKAIPNNQILGKIERAIGIKLRGKDKGSCYFDWPIMIGQYGSIFNNILLFVECFKGKPWPNSFCTEMYCV